MWDVVLEAVIDSLKMFPFLLLAYILVEVFSHYFSSKLENGIMTNTAPVFGGLLGIIPQCGFSVVSAELYTRRFITIGTLFAVFLATSDEAILVLITSPEGLRAVIPLIAIKLVSAIVIGLLIDVIFERRNKRLMTEANNQSQSSSNEQILEDVDREVGENVHCDCCCYCEKSAGKFETFILKPFLHSLKIFAFILVMNILFSVIVFYMGEDNVVDFLQSSIVFAPLFSALVGLIPNCASSVIISQLYILGGLNFASLVAGLCANAGVASLILFRKIKLKETLSIIFAIFAISVAIGYLLMLLKVSF